jgi:phage shock protein A
MRKIMDLNELHQREIDSLRDENIELRKKVEELEAKIQELESEN